MSDNNGIRKNEGDQELPDVTGIALSDNLIFSTPDTVEHFKSTAMWQNPSSFASNPFILENNTLAQTMDPSLLSENSATFDFQMEMYRRVSNLEMKVNDLATENASLREEIRSFMQGKFEDKYEVNDENNDEDSEEDKEEDEKEGKEEPEESQVNPAHIPRPRNNWIIFRCDKAKEMRNDPEYSQLNSRELSTIVSKMWRDTPEEVKNQYKALALQEKEDHAKKYPNYKFTPKTAVLSD